MVHERREINEVNPTVLQLAARPQQWGVEINRIQQSYWVEEITEFREATVSQICKAKRRECRERAQDLQRSFKSLAKY